MQKLNREAKVYNNYKKMWHKKAKKHKSLIRFHNANKIDNYNKAGEKKEKNPKESIENKSKLLR